MLAHSHKRGMNACAGRRRRSFGAAPSDDVVVRPAVDWRVKQNESSSCAGRIGVRVVGRDHRPGERRLSWTLVPFHVRGGARPGLRAGRFAGVSGGRPSPRPVGRIAWDAAIAVKVTVLGAPHDLQATIAGARGRGGDCRGGGNTDRVWHGPGPVRRRARRRPSGGRFEAAGRSQPARRLNRLHAAAQPRDEQPVRPVPRPSRTQVQNDYHIEFSMPVSVYGQWARPQGGPGDALLVYTPSMIMDAVHQHFESALARSKFFQFQSYQFWTRATTGIPAGSMGLITQTERMGRDTATSSPSSLTRIHFPATGWKSPSGSILSPRTMSTSMPAMRRPISSTTLSRRTARRPMPMPARRHRADHADHSLQFATGLQSATDISGHALTTNGFGSDKVAYFLLAQWTTKFLGGGTYSILDITISHRCRCSRVRRKAFRSAPRRISTTKYGVFVRVNNASGDDIPIETSVAVGGIVNDPFDRLRLDQAGAAIVWDKTNKAAIDSPSRNAEWSASCTTITGSLRACSSRRICRSTSTRRSPRKPTPPPFSPCGPRFISDFSALDAALRPGRIAGPAGMGRQASRRSAGLSLVLHAAALFGLSLLHPVRPPEAAVAAFELVMATPDADTAPPAPQAGRAGAATGRCRACARGHSAACRHRAGAAAPCPGPA